MLYLIRGLPGSGKSCFAHSQKFGGMLVIENDQFFVRADGSYVHGEDVRESSVRSYVGEVVEVALRHGINVVVANCLLSKTSVQKLTRIADRYNTACRIFRMNGRFESQHEGVDKFYKMMELSFEDIEGEELVSPDYENITLEEREPEMKYKNDNIGNRMKGYEDVSRIYLTKRMPVIIRIDGKAFHSFTRGFVRPFDDVMSACMQDTMKYLCENIGGCMLGYTQSDEISLLLVDYKNLDTNAWFEKNLQKTVSVCASMATFAFNRSFAERSMNAENAEIYKSALTKGALFDARAFVIPKEEVCNYFIWRQQDATRNSIQMVARANFSDEQCYKRNCNDLQELLFSEKGINWNDFPVRNKRGSCCKTQSVTACKNGIEYTRQKWVIDEEIPIFTADRSYIEQLVNV